MLCVIIPTLNSQKNLPQLLTQLCTHPCRIVVSDGGSGDETITQAVTAGAIMAIGERGRGTQLARGGVWAQQSEWLLFVHADCQLSHNWYEMVQAHIRHYPDKIGYFRFCADSSDWRARIMEQLVYLRCYLFHLPYGDQGLLISRAMYEATGGYGQEALFEDVAFIYKLRTHFGRRVLRCIPAPICTDVEAYQRQGFLYRSARNIILMWRYRRGTPISELAQAYQIVTD